MKDFLDYDIKYPDLVIRLMEFFQLRSGEKPMNTIQGFVQSYKVSQGETPLQPDIIGRICDRLCDMRKMTCLRKTDAMRLNDVFFAFPIDQAVYQNHHDMLVHHFNSYVYGMEYIYRAYKERTLPVVVTLESSDLSMGSCFRIFDGIATAKHCLLDGSSVAIRGYSKEQLERCPVFVSANPDMDIAFIRTGETFIFNNAEPRVLDNVLVMGYPKLPFFLDFCTGEKANISAMADLRLTPTLGSIAAEGEIYNPRNLPKMLLVTAKMYGGNSGGPVINEEGYVVGIATGLPDGEGFSDDHVGYGMAYPIQSLIDMIDENYIIKVEFADFKD